MTVTTLNPQGRPGRYIPAGEIDGQKLEMFRPDFDLHGFYDWQVRIALENTRLSANDKRTKLKSLIQRAYEQGIVDAKKDKTYFDDY